MPRTLFVYVRVWSEQHIENQREHTRDGPNPIHAEPGGCPGEFITQGDPGEGWEGLEPSPGSLKRAQGSALEEEARFSVLTQVLSRSRGRLLHCQDSTVERAPGAPAVTHPG